MIKGLLKKLIGKEIPLVTCAEDLIDQRAYKLAKENFLRITDIPSLYFELDKTGGQIEIDPSRLKGDTLPKEHNQILAGAIINYEITKRSVFQILVDKKTFADFGGVEINGLMYGVIKRRVSIAQHESVANIYVETVDKIYRAFEEANKKP
jgi:hypothetical protein